MTDLATSPVYQAYAYAYPHKTAYRRLDPAPPLDALWAGEDRGALFLYVHVPFCEYRCGFCNLFTRRSPGDDLVRAWLATLRRQAARVRAALGGEVRFARMAVGGGTPTYLDTSDLAAVLDLAEGMGAPLGAIPISVETSPDSAEPDKLALLRARGVTRVSLGVQSFVEAEARAVSRPQRTAAALRALDALRGAGFPVLNVDLMYGLPGQTEETWLGSIRAALRFAPEELYLYPLYVRPLTGLGIGRRGSQKAEAVGSQKPEAVTGDDARLRLYRAGRALLLEHGYAQRSLRMFRREGAPGEGGPAYCCQDDGMVGLGCGARSYTRAVHYASEWAVSQEGVLGILEEWIARGDERFDVAEWGYVLGPDDQRRRWVIQSLLQAEGLSRASYARRFGTDALADLPGLAELPALGWATLDAERLALTEAGMERSDAIGPWLCSEEAARRMAAAEVR